MDLTQPLCYVGYEVETLILLGTPKARIRFLLRVQKKQVHFHRWISRCLPSRQVLLQKWCVAEMAIARLQNIHSVLVGLPDFRMPDATFITNYMPLG